MEQMGGGADFHPLSCCRAGKISKNGFGYF